MKRCPKCHAIQSGNRFFCIDCGARLDAPLSPEDARKTEEEIADTLSDLSEGAEILRLTKAGRVIGYISVAAVTALIAALLLIDRCGYRVGEMFSVSMLLAIVAFGGAALFALGSRFLWWVETQRERLLYGEMPAPSMSWATLMAVLRNIFLIAGCFALIGVVRSLL